MEFETEAEQDLVQVYYGGLTEAASTLTQTLSGANLTTTHQYIPSNLAIVKFMTDSSLTAAGIHLDWTACKCLSVY